VLAVKFLNDHKRHRDKLAEDIKKFGGKPVHELPNYDVAAIAKGVGVEELKAEADIIRLAARLEEQATKAYLGIVASFESVEIVKQTAQIAADEATHTAILKAALNEFADSKSYL
jgi:rubrerythrin